jgi:EAL domain-containing protein (putative c-di-GMP-specific phosphodiesterase class I)
VARVIRDETLPTRVLALSAYEDRSLLLEMLRAGASGYLVKGTRSREIFDAIGRVAGGESVVSPELTSGVVDELALWLEREDRIDQDLRRRAGQVEDLLTGDALSIVFQPIVSLSRRAPVGCEALSRFGVRPEEGPQYWFSEARQVGLLEELEIAAARAAVSRTEQLPPDGFLALNLSPGSAIAITEGNALGTLPANRLVIEITEHAPVEDYDGLARALEAFRFRGGRLAVDDAGAGFASLRHILQLRPDFIKLDIGLTRGIESDHARRALAAGLTSFAAELGAVVIAEGIETEEQVEALVELGVACGQGYHLGEPGSIG